MKDLDFFEGGAPENGDPLRQDALTPSHSLSLPPTIAGAESDGITGIPETEATIRPAIFGRESIDDPFPIEHLPDALKDLVNEFADKLNLPPMMLAISGLAVVSAAMGNAIQIKSGGERKTMGNLYFIISARSGTGKSTALDRMLRPLKDEEAYLQEYPAGCETISRSAFNGHPDGLNDAEVAVMAENPPMGGTKQRGNSRTQLISDDVTCPSLAKLLSENQVCTFNVSAEAGERIDETARKRSQLKSIWLKGYSGDTIDVNRITRDPIRLNSPCITLLWLCQPHRLDEFLSNARLVEDGLTARILVASCDAEMLRFPEVNEDINPQIEDRFGAIISGLLSRRAGGNASAVVSCSQEALNALKEFYDGCRRDWPSEDYARIQSIVCRWPEQAWKIALVLHAASHGGDCHKEPLPEETALSAIIITRWFIRQQLAMLAKPDTSRINPRRERRERLELLLRNAPGHRISLRDLTNAHGFKADECNEMAQAFPEIFEVSKHQNPKGGRPSKMMILKSIQK